eukprot:CAMPEP_0119326940 /NCGR_PEP_ID=MMETSP1333-20130426/69598_1 /TAXON_ID=418940 /ORGANISM="Scyphosphaera apsteinii, Strain RCC1455" /LENGTH=143 /DNA_ID=CAMNT_0007335381 /DNA_START=114 /DNA_END=545 /DNA_ORIENTATION=-
MGQCEAEAFSSPRSYQLSTMCDALLNKPVLGRRGAGIGMQFEVSLVSNHTKKNDFIMWNPDEKEIVSSRELCSSDATWLDTLKRNGDTAKSVSGKNPSVPREERMSGDSVLAVEPGQAIERSGFVMGFGFEPGEDLDESASES